MFVPSNDDFHLTSEEGRKLTFQVLLPFFSVKEKNSQSFAQFLLLVATLSFTSSEAKERQQKALTLSKKKSCFNTSRRCIYCAWHHYHYYYSKIMVHQKNYLQNCLSSFRQPQARPAGLGIWQYFEVSFSSDLCSS